MILNRFSGTNGIFQLIALLESCSDDRRRLILSSIAKEDPALASLLRTKVLTCAHVFSWEARDLGALFEDLCGSPDQLVSDFMELVDVFAPNLSKGDWMSQLETRMNYDRFAHLDELRIKSKANFSRETAGAVLMFKVRELERIGRLDLREIDPPKAMATGFPTLSRVA
jgi:hypothetical protein